MVTTFRHTVQQELASLAAAGLITVRRQGNQKHFQANAASPVFAELCGPVLKTLEVDERPGHGRSARGSSAASELSWPPS